MGQLSRTINQGQLIWGQVKIIWSPDSDLLIFFLIQKRSNKGSKFTSPSNYRLPQQFTILGSPEAILVI